MTSVTASRMTMTMTSSNMEDKFITEEWRDIPGYEGKYQASTLGRIRSLDRRARIVTHGAETTRLVRGRVLHPECTNKLWHVYIRLGIGNGGMKSKTWFVHQLVALTFIGPRPDNMEVCHNDGNAANNALSNLRYDTRTENVRDILRTGGKIGKLRLDEVDEIRKLFENGATRSEVADQFGITKGAATKIKCRRTFGWYETKKVSE